LVDTPVYLCSLGILQLSYTHLGSIPHSGRNSFVGCSHVDMDHGIVAVLADQMDR
jgi:hypothetical protein